MTVVNGYCTVVQCEEELSIPAGSVGYTAKLERSIAAASRQIDGHCGRRFWQDAAVVARYYTPDGMTVQVDDISTTTGLLVAYDSGDDGLYATSLTINTQFVLWPANAAVMAPVWPYTEIRSLYDSLPYSTTGRQTVKVTAKFGWPAVPDDVTKACLVQAGQLFKAADAPFGAVALGFEQSGVQRVSARLNPMAVALLEPYVKVYA